MMKYCSDDIEEDTRDRLSRLLQDLQTIDETITSQATTHWFSHKSLMINGCINEINYVLEGKHL